MVFNQVIIELFHVFPKNYNPCTDDKFYMWSCYCTFPKSSDFYMLPTSKDILVQSQGEQNSSCKCKSCIRDILLVYSWIKGLHANQMPVVTSRQVTTSQHSILFSLLIRDHQVKGYLSQSKSTVTWAYSYC